MTGRLGLLAFVVATGSVHLLPVLPGAVVQIVLSMVLAATVLTGVIARRQAWSRGIWLVPLGAALAGFLLTVVRAEMRLVDALDDTNVNLVSRVELRVISLPQRHSGMQSFDAQVVRSIPEGVPATIRVSWRSSDWRGPYAAEDTERHEMPDIIPGQVWRMALILKPPHGTRNPNGFDYERHTFANGVRAMGTVRGTPVLLRDEPWHALNIMAERARYVVREAMLPHLEGKRYGAVLLALVIGDQASVEARDWEVFNRTGITHLVSISGTHVTMIASLAGLLVTALWRRLKYKGLFLAEHCPAQIAGTLAALFVAWLYCLLAGWGVPAQRTFLMLAVIALAYVFRLALASSRLLLIAAFVVVVMDPWAMLSSGFWLSFGAVAVLMAATGAHGGLVRTTTTTAWSRIKATGWEAIRLQLMISVALLPALAVLFHEVSIASPLANAYAIPVISVVVTPAALTAGLLAVLPGMQNWAGTITELAHFVLQMMMVPTNWLADRAIASITTAAAPVMLTVLALCGLVVAMAPKGLPRGVLGWVLIFPALMWIPGRPSTGEWKAVALDVGQASAIAIQTSRHDFLFDAGVRYSPDVDSSVRVIWPYFRSRGIKKLDALIISHADIDHVGGLRSLLDKLHVEQSYASFSVDNWLRHEASQLGTADAVRRPNAITACGAGQRWTVDGVTFQFIWPLQGSYSGIRASSRERNDNSCVLSVQGRFHSLLLTGDIGAFQEKELVRRGLDVHDVVMGAHHGSNSSSDIRFIQALQAQHVVAQAGSWSRYGHPHPAVIRRWTNSGAMFWRTDLDGAVLMDSRQQGLTLMGERQRRPRYWQVGR